MRVTCRVNQRCLKTSHTSFDDLSKVFLYAHRKSHATITYNIHEATKGDGNLVAMLAAIGYDLRSRYNRLDIGPKKHGYNRIRIEETLFGYVLKTFEFHRLPHYSSATPVQIFRPSDYHRFDEYVVKSLIREDWKEGFPVHYWLRIKYFLRQLFKNSAKYSGNGSPIFLSSCFKNNMLQITIADCGLGFLPHIISEQHDIRTEEEAIRWAMMRRKKNSCHAKQWRSLTALGHYCKGNGGYLKIVSQTASVDFDPLNKYRSARLSAPFPGTVINFAVKIRRQKFESQLSVAA